MTRSTARMAALSSALVAALAGSPAAVAHDWYPVSCCSGTDCKPIPVTDVEATPTGYRIRQTGEVIPYSRVRPSPDGQFHRCSVGGRPDGATIGQMFPEGACLWAPAGLS